MRGWRRHFVGLVAAGLGVLWARSMMSPAVHTIDGGLRLTCGAGGVGITWSRRDANGIILLDLKGVPMGYGFTSVGGYRGGGSMVAELRGQAHITIREVRLLPWMAGGSSVRILHLPLWPALVGMVGLGAMWWRSGRRVRSGFCRGCEYDMRALPEASRCPECGMESAAARG